MTLGVYASLSRSHDWRPALQRVRAPTLVLHGANDLQPESDSRAVAAVPGESSRPARPLRTRTSRLQWDPGAVYRGVGRL